MFEAKKHFQSNWSAAGLIVLLAGLSVILGPTLLAREKVALVLGGGGARGIAHLGVIRWFEEHRIPVDMVVGTSLGGLIGGVYSMGYSSEELDTLVGSIDWTKVLAGSPPYREMAFRRKEDASDYPVGFEVGLRNGLSVPSGLNPGHFIDLLLQRLSVPYGSLQSFDELPIPFRCVAVDLESGREKVFSDGQLWEALRATMAIPGVFTPTQVRGHLYVDGGILNNVPADVARRLGADVVIAVDVGSPLRSADELSSILGVADQTISIMMINNVRRIIRQADLIISPDLEGIFTLDFGDTSEIAERGYSAVESKRRFLSTLSVSPSEWEEHIRSRLGRRRTRLPDVAGLTVAGVGEQMSKTIRQQLEDQVPGPLRPDQLESRLTQIYSINKFDSVGYQVDEVDGKKVLDVIVQPASHGPPFVRFGLFINGSDIDAVRFGLRTRLTAMDWGFQSSETRIDLGVGAPNFAAVEYYVPVWKGWFVAPRGTGSRETIYLFEGDTRSAEYLQRKAGFGLDLGYGFQQSSQELRIGYAITDFSGRPRVGPPGLPRLDGNVTSARVQWKLNRLNDAVIPSSGVAVDLTWTRYFAGPGIARNLDQWSGRAQIFFPATRRDTLFSRVSGGATANTDPPLYLDFTLGGPLNLGAYEIDQFRASRVVYGSTGVLHRVVDNSLFFGGATYIGTWYEVGSAFDRHQKPDYRHVGSAGIVLDSIVGPLFIGGSWGESSRFRLYFSLGTLFR